MMTRDKILRIIIMTVAILLALMMYGTEYSISNNVTAIEEGISEFIEYDVKVIRMEKVDNTIFVYFADQSNNNIGYTVLYRGLNFRYQIRKANYGSRDRVIYIREFKTYRNKYWAVYGTNFDEKIDKIVFDDEYGTIELNDLGNMSEILSIVESKNEFPGTSVIFKYRLIDIGGNDITKDMRSYISDSGINGFGRGKAELFLLNVFCLAILLVGFWIARSVGRKVSVDSFT